MCFTRKIPARVQEARRITLSQHNSLRQYHRQRKTSRIEMSVQRNATDLYSIPSRLHKLLETSMIQASASQCLTRSLGTISERHVVRTITNENSAPFAAIRCWSRSSCRLERLRDDGPCAEGWSRCRRR